MLGDMGGDPRHAVVVLEHVAQGDRLLQDAVELLDVADPLGLARLRNSRSRVSRSTRSSLGARV